MGLYIYFHLQVRYVHSTSHRVRLLTTCLSIFPSYLFLKVVFSYRNCKHSFTKVSYLRLVLFLNLHNWKKRKKNSRLHILSCLTQMVESHWKPSFQNTGGCGHRNPPPLFRVFFKCSMFWIFMVYIFHKLFNFCFTSLDLKEISARVSFSDQILSGICLSVRKNLTFSSSIEPLHQFQSDLVEIILG